MLGSRIEMIARKGGESEESVDVYEMKSTGDGDSVDVIKRESRGLWRMPCFPI